VYIARIEADHWRKALYRVKKIDGAHWLGIPQPDGFIVAITDAVGAGAIPAALPGTLQDCLAVALSVTGRTRKAHDKTPATITQAAGDGITQDGGTQGAAFADLSASERSYVLEAGLDDSHERGAILRALRRSVADVPTMRSLWLRAGWALDESGERASGDLDAARRLLGLFGELAHTHPNGGTHALIHRGAVAPRGDSPGDLLPPAKGLADRNEYKTDLHGETT
jgi:hypothetical protein